MKSKVLVILGPTASGKSDLAVAFAKKYNGEVISADSRQVYKGLDIGSGKITKKEMLGVPHYLLDVASPKKIYTVDMWTKQANSLIADIRKRGKLPIICGGTGFYIKALVDNIALPDVPINKELRKKLLLKSPASLFAMLKKLDARRAKEIHPNNKVKVMRAIEVAKALGKVPKIKQTAPQYDFLQIGIKTADKKLKERIEKRLISRIKKGMIKEVENLHASGLRWKRLEEFGLEYRYIALFLQKKISKQEMIDLLNTKIWQYAKRQLTWFKKDRRIKWFSYLAATTVNVKR
jgi:tRNA dimethylallyltransferase